MTSDRTVTVHFIEKEDESGPDNTGYFQGITMPPLGHKLSGRKEWEIPVYAEIGEKGTVTSPYGNDNYGFLVLMFDPSVTYVVPDQNGSCNFFAVPLKISGFQKDDEGRSWMVVDGGTFTAANVSTGGDMFSLLIDMMLGIDDMKSVTAKPRHYRIEMHDIDSDTGEFTFGSLQTYSPDAGGYVYGDDESLEKTKYGYFVDMTDRGYPSDTFSGAVMKQAQKRNDVQWYPPESWSKDKSAYETLLEMMREGYRTAKSNYEQLFGN